MQKLFNFLFCASSIFQMEAQEYWQQEVNYTISVRLNDIDHTLSAFETFEYVNHSPHTLTEIYIHLWPNAYRNGKTALAKQLYANKEKMLRFASETDRGWIDSLDFKVEGKVVSWNYDPLHIDICKITLNEPLLSGQKVTISTPFKVKIPNGKISRLGHIEQSYQITQWYPKPAVYDKNGWNQMPYLNQGEFYSEYGSYDVSITLPANYVVGATGDLQTESEKVFLEKKVQWTTEKLSLKQPTNRTDGIDSAENSFPPSDATIKTIRYTQRQVHDFAWFADKRYYVQKGEVELPHTKSKVSSWALFTYQNSYLWKKAIQYINDGVYYYSLWNGDYPYSQVTAVDGTISAGGGMEYPNVTVIGNASSDMELETVIVHEVGHNWFYGILGTNERVHGWMDEGLNTLNEMRYIQTKYPKNKELSDMLLGGRFHFNDLNHHDSGDLGYRLFAMLAQDQAIETHSADFTSLNYATIMYQKTGLVFLYLKAVLGEKLFDESMQAYYSNWKFKHPQPEDLKVILEKTTQKDLSWLFEDLIQTTRHLDFKIKKVKKLEDGTEITFKNKGQMKAPLVFTAFSGTEKEEYVTDPFSKKMTFKIPKQDLSQIIIDESKQIPELFRNNNSWNNHRMIKKSEACKLEFLIGDHERERNNHFWAPALGTNAADQFMLGLSFHNFGIPFKKFQYFVAPMYSFGRQNISGIAEFNLTFLPAALFKLSRFGLSVKSFATESLSRKGDSFHIGLAPYWFAKLNTRGKDHQQSILLQTIYRYDQNFGSSTSFVTLPVSPLDYYTNHAGIFLQHTLSITKPDFSFGTETRVEYFDNLENGDQVFRTSLALHSTYNYLKNKMKRQVEWRIFAGKIWDIRNSNYNARNLDYTYASTGANGMQDLFLEEYFFNRSTSLPYSLQHMDNMGGIRSSGNYGATTNYLTTFNFYFQLPIKPNLLGIFADYGLFYANPKVESIYTIGLGLKLGKILGFYFPIWMSNKLEASYPTKEYASRIRMTVKLNFVNKPLQLSTLF